MRHQMTANLLSMSDCACSVTAVREIMILAVGFFPVIIINTHWLASIILQWLTAVEVICFMNVYMYIYSNIFF